MVIKLYNILDMKYLILVTFVLGLYACGNNYSGANNIDDSAVDSTAVESDGVVIDTGHSYGDKQASWHEGAPAVYEAETKEELNLISQMNTYDTALLNGDINGASFYVYKDAIVYFRESFNGLSDDEIAEKFLEPTLNLKKQLDNLYENGVDVNVKIIVTNIINRVKNGSDLIYVFEITGCVTYGDRSLYKDPDKTVGVSLDNGLSWKFITLNEDTRDILRLRFNDEVIDRVLD